ncbi:GH25 family lysozyme [Sphingomonas sp. GC_Shp_3]|uniref:glycoside hydrolase family 25 protein n=1 Tax=Sphingomonas sp. GC_Shp_3 TaxID=2937383 RepID=UPI00226A2B81|nr:GH25 family lysozyme [Sphingomonas sp. GC_Shp_3]
MVRLNTWGKRIIAAAAILVIVAVTAGVLWLWAQQWQPSGKYPIQGIDVSDDAGEIDWWSVQSAGADFAYVRATTGAAGRDMRFAANWEELAKTRLRRGAMHRYSLCNSAVDQANNFNTTVPRTRAALPAAVELDFTDDCTARPEAKTLVEDLRRFLTMVEALTGTPVLLKISRAFDRTYGVTSELRRPVWAVGNFFPPTYTARPWQIWQANDMRHIDGVDGSVHWDVVRP